MMQQLPGLYRTGFLYDPKLLWPIIKIKLISRDTRNMTRIIDIIKDINAMAIILKKLENLTKMGKVC